MKIKGETGIMVHSFYASPEEMDWTLALRRKDGETDQAFARYGKQDVPAEFLRQLIPDWENLEWEELKVPDLFPRELRGESGPYHLHLILGQRSQLTSEKVVSQFKSVMSGRSD